TKEIDIETGEKFKYDIELLIESTPVEIRRKAKMSAWNPSRRLEISQNSTITIVIKGNKSAQFWNKRESEATFNGQEIFNTFWESKDSISNDKFWETRNNICAEFQPFSYAVDKLQLAMETHRPLMGILTQQRVETAVKYGTALSEMNPFAKAAFAVVTATFELLKEQQKGDSMVSELAGQIQRVLPFAQQALEEILYEDTELLESAVKNLFSLIMDAAGVICDY
ncbi:1631_t:CDS:2, partial [Acaulospora colombiana]